MKDKAKEMQRKRKGNANEKATQRCLLNMYLNFVRLGDNPCRHFCRLSGNRSYLNFVLFAEFRAFLAKINPGEGDQRDKVNCERAGKTAPTALSIRGTAVVPPCITVPVPQSIVDCFPCLVS
jgi:hypothetical protein